MKKLPNFITRVLAGIVFIVLLLGGILTNEYTFAAVFTLLIALALYEFYGLIENDAKVNVSKWLNIVGGILLFWGVFCYSKQGGLFALPLFFHLIPYAVYLLALVISELYLKRSNPLQSLAYSLFGQAYIAIPFVLTNKLVFSGVVFIDYSYIFLLAILVIIWVNDSFAYLAGMALGKHRLFERISPKKSWEGFFGGLIFSIIASLILAYFYPVLSTAGWIGFAIVVVAFGTFGDLVESLFKRTLGVKDSGKMIPGHGGILDRFDSTIFAIPTIVIYLEVLRLL